MRVLVTGATGFLASHLIEQLLRDEPNIIVNGTVRSLKDTKKYQHLLDLPKKYNLPEDRLVLFEADLVNGNFDKAVEGCEVVFHTASPYSLTCKDPQKELVEPAIRGTLSVLESVNKFKDQVKRVIVTSSVAAITDGGIKDHTFTEKDWNQTSSLKNNPYYYSKTLAEQAAHKYCAQHSIELIVINPFLIVGKSHTATLNESNKLFVRLMTGEFPGVINLSWGMVDVEDVAKAHILAMKYPSEKLVKLNADDFVDDKVFQADSNVKLNRFICCADTKSMQQVVDFLKEQYPDYSKKLPSKDFQCGLGDILVKFSALFMAPGEKQYMNSNLSKAIYADNSKIKTEFGMEFKPLEESFKESVDDLIRWNHIPDLRK